MQKSLTIKKVMLKLKSVKMAPYNPRVISNAEKEKLRKSLTTLGYADPMVWNRKTNHVVGGNQRLIVLLEEDVEEAEFVEVNLSLKNEKLLNVALNKIAGDWDYQKLTDLFKSFDADADLTVSGFDKSEIDVLLNENIDASAALKDEDAEEEQTDDQNVEHVATTTSFVIFLSFKNRDKAVAYAKEKFNKEFRANARTVIVDMEEQ